MDSYILTGEDRMLSNCLANPDCFFLRFLSMTFWRATNFWNSRTSSSEYPGPMKFNHSNIIFTACNAEDPGITVSADVCWHCSIAKYKHSQFCYSDRVPADCRTRISSITGKAYNQIIASSLNINTASFATVTEFLQTAGQGAVVSQVSFKIKSLHHC